MRKNVRELIAWLLLAAGMLSPLTVFPLTRSRIPLAADLFCLSLSCMLWMAVRVVRGRRGDRWSEPWHEDSSELKRWSRTRTWIYGLALSFLIVSLFLFRPWRPGQINWQMTISAPGYMLLVWGAIVSNYIVARRPARTPRMNPLHQPMAPIRSDHWGSSPGTTHSIE
jgi:hypothetical protein